MCLTSRKGNNMGAARAARIVEIKGFEILESTENKDRLVMEAHAVAKRGKTHFGLGAPGPIALFNFDHSEEEVRSKFPDTQIVVSNFDKPYTAAGVAGMNWKKELLRFEQNLADALRSKCINTLVIDTFTDVWAMMRMFYFGKLAQVRSHHYAAPNAHMDGIVNSMLPHDKDVILLHKMSAEYVNDKSTGKHVRAGFSHMSYLPQLTSRLLYLDGEFVCRIVESRHDPKLNGFELTGDMCNFETLKSIVLA